MLPLEIMTLMIVCKQIPIVSLHTNVFNRPNVINKLIHSVILCVRTFKNLSTLNRKSCGAEILRKCSPPTLCHISYVTCHVSLVSCQVSGVTCHMLRIIIIIYFLLFLDKVLKLVGGGSVINRAYFVQFIYQNIINERGASLIGIFLCLKQRCQVMSIIVAAYVDQCFTLVLIEDIIQENYSYL